MKYITLTLGKQQRGGLVAAKIVTFDIVRRILLSINYARVFKKQGGALYSSIFDLPSPVSFFVVAFVVVVDFILSRLIYLAVSLN